MIAPQMAEIAALVGDPARANILVALFDGRALTATELSYAASVSPQTTSGHLAKLTQARLLTVVKQGRHRYYRLATPLVAQMMETIMAVAAEAPPRHRPRAALAWPEPATTISPDGSALPLLIRYARAGTSFWATTAVR